MARYIDLDKAIESIRNGDGTSMQKLFAECCLLAVPTADVAPKSEVARKIFAEIEEGLQYEIDLEDKNGRNAWGEGDTIGFQIHEYAEDKLDTLQIALSLLKKKYGVTDTNVGDKCTEGEQ